MNSGNTNQSKSGWLGIGGAFAPVMPLDIRGSTTESFWVRNGTTYFFAGADNANKRARIGAYEEGVGWKNLIINEGGGNVGIGTTGPGAKLQVDTLSTTGTGRAQLGVISGGWWGGQGVGNYFGGWATDTQPLLKVESWHGSDGRDKIFQVARAGDTPYLTVQGGGNVGIGTTGPGAKLDVAGGVIQRGIIPYGVGGDSGGSSAGNDYAFGYQEAGSWTYPYPDLILGYHTGIKIGGYWNYNGVRFYNDHPSRAGATEIFSVGNGDSNVRVVNNLIVSGQVQTTGGIRFNDGTTQTSAASGGMYRRTLPNPTTNQFTSEPNIDDMNWSTYATGTSPWISQFGGGRAYLDYDLGEMRYFIFNWGGWSTTASGAWTSVQICFTSLSDCQSIDPNGWAGYARYIRFVAGQDGGWFGASTINIREVTLIY